VSGEGPAWIEESLDLSPYTGQEILIRFEYVTDDAINRSGWTLDDIGIPEIGFSDDAEGGLNGWQAEGFVRIENVLPQRFLVQVIEIGDEVTVRSIPLDETNYGTLTLTGLGSTLDRAILIVSGLTPVTTEPASYQYKLVQ
jgi:immune inhibitor A